MKGPSHDGDVADITDLLNRWSAGDQQAFDALMPLVYADLKRVAQRSLQSERNAFTLDCTALVHEAYLRLVDQNRMTWESRAHFFGAAARVMRRILVETRAPATFAKARFGSIPRIHR